ncbi:MAG: Flagellar basal-body rod protein FlgB [Micavibrio sp.]|nr:Flagellar basal-body rod protein FlgB [Micavibrio sp.]
MGMQQLGLFQALGAKMNYLDQRQKVISQNIANANTPDYKPKDLEKVDFSSALSSITGDTSTITPDMTNKMHLSPNALPTDEAKSQQMKKTYDVTPTGNAVVMEEQMVKSTETMTDYNLMTAIYQKNVNMMRTALGR